MRFLLSIYNMTLSLRVEFYLILLVNVLITALTSVTCSASKEIVFYISPMGNDAWSGKLPAPNAAGTDGPFATISRARNAIRALKKSGLLIKPVTVYLRDGQYFLDETISFGPIDSGYPNAPITYRAYKAEHPVIVGGRLVDSFRKRGHLLVTKLPQVTAGRGYFRSLFVDSHREIRAREPNLDPTDPYRKGFFYVQHDYHGFGFAVGNIHNRGDWLEYDINVPADGEYFLWVYYAALNRPLGINTMDNRTAVKVDNGEFRPLVGLTDTGGWNIFKWSRVGVKFHLASGHHILHWENLKGGSLNIEAWALIDDPAWQPHVHVTELPKPANGRHLILIQAENFTRSHGPQISVSGSNGSTTSFTYNAGDLNPSWANASDAEIHIFQSGSCRAFLEICKLVAIDPVKRKVKVRGPECIAELKPGDRYWIENVPQLLDQPHEWYLDRTRGELLYMPPADFSSDRSQVIVPTIGRIIELIGDEKTGHPVKYIRFIGLTFSYNDYSPADGCVGFGMGNNGTLYLHGAENCEISNCKFINIGKYAVCLVRGHNPKLCTSLYWLGKPIEMVT